MSPRPSTLLGLVLCLGQMIHMTEGALPKPSLRVQPGPVVPRGRPVTFVCRGLEGAEVFCLEKDGRPVSPYQKCVYQDGLPVAEARFPIPAVSEDTAGKYTCLYLHANVWSERGEALQLQVTEEVVSIPSTPPSATRPDVTLPPTEVTPSPTEKTSQTSPASRDYMVENSIRLGLAGVVLLILVAILVEAGLSQRRSPQGPQE